MKMPLCLNLVDDVYEPNQLQPTLVRSLSPPKPMTYPNTKPGRLFVITDKNQMIVNHDQYEFQLQSSLGEILPSALAPLHQEKWEGKGSWTDPPEIAGDPPPPQDSLQAPAGGRPVITLGIRAAL